MIQEDVKEICKAYQNALKPLIDKLIHLLRNETNPKYYIKNNSMIKIKSVDEMYLECKINEIKESYIKEYPGILKPI